MKQKITNGEVKLLMKCLEELSNNEVKLSVNAWFKLSKNSALLETADSHTESTRVQLVKQYGKEGENGTVVVPEEDMDAFKTAYISLLSQMTDIDFEMIKMTELTKETKEIHSVAGIYKFFKYMVKDDTETTKITKSTSKKKSEKKLESV